MRTISSFDDYKAHYYPKRVESERVESRKKSDSGANHIYGSRLSREVRIKIKNDIKEVHSEACR